MKHAFILTEVEPTPHGALTATRQSGPPSVPIDSMLAHLGGFNMSEFYTWEKRHLTKNCDRIYVTYFLHMPQIVHFNFGDKIVEELKNNPKYFLVCFSMLEGVITPEQLASAAKDKGLPLEKIIVVCSNYPADKTTQNGIKFVYIDFWESFTRFHQRCMPGSTELNINERKKSLPRARRKFLCLNRNIKAHRIWFYWLLLQKNLVERNHVSYHLPRINKPQYMLEALNYDTTKYIPKLLHKEYHIALKRQIHPRQLDKIDSEYIINYRETIKPFYKDSLFSIVTESDFRLPFLTEKTYKAIAHCHPFFIIGNPEHHRLLREKGYYTFENFFGVSQVTNWEEAELFLDTISRIDLETYRSKVAEILPMLEHNYNNFFERSLEWSEVKQKIDSVAG